MLPDGGAIVSHPLVEVLTFEGCPHAEPTFELVARVASELGVDALVKRIDVADLDEARTYGFLGSPTIRVNGSDIEPGAHERTEPTLSCRVYLTESGLRGAPDERWLREALTAA